MHRTGYCINSIIFWGSMWGITEATVGHVLHITGLSCGWVFWFPLAFNFMYQAYRQTGYAYVAFAAACVAAGIKLVDLVAPGRLDYVVNPAVAILLEGVAVSAVYTLSRVLSHHVHVVSLDGLVIASSAWRVFYLLYACLFMPLDWQAISPLAGWMSLSKFLVWENAVNITFTQVFLRVATQQRCLAVGILSPFQRLASSILLFLTASLYQLLM